MNNNIVGFIIKEGPDDYTLWRGEFTSMEKAILNVVASSHETDGESVRGDKNVSIADFETPISRGSSKDTVLWDVLKSHFGHDVEIALYGDPADPVDVCLEDMDTGAVILDAELYTLAARNAPGGKRIGQQAPLERELAETKAKLASMTAMFSNYVSNDSEAADADYVREALCQIGAYEKETLEELGLSWLMEEEEG